LIQANLSSSDHLKKPKNSKMVNICRVERTVKAFSDMALGCKVVDLIGFYSVDRPLDALVFGELQRYRLDGLR
jgi:hypothetical protein